MVAKAADAAVTVVNVARCIGVEPHGHGHLARRVAMEAPLVTRGQEVAVHGVAGRVQLDHARRRLRRRRAFPTSSALRSL